MENINIGIDLGGSHVSIGIINNEGKILEQYEKDFTVEEKQNLIHVAIEFIVQTVEKLKEKYCFYKIGLGMAGAISNGIILKSVNLGVYDLNMKHILEERLNLDVEIKNDAKCACIAEYKFGEISSYKNVLFMTLGTGIGGAYIYQGKLLEGTCFEAMEFGHMIIKAGGLKCKCGKLGCFEKYGSILVFKSKVIERLNLNNNISGPDLRKAIAENEDKITDIKEEYINDLTIRNI